MQGGGGRLAPVFRFAQNPIARLYVAYRGTVAQLQTASAASTQMRAVILQGDNP
jgi:hypothetical protein